MGKKKNVHKFPCEDFSFTKFMRKVFFLGKIEEFFVFVIILKVKPNS